ncbi:MAG: ATP-binding protein, partial [Spirochaetota bacterium]
YIRSRIRQSSQPRTEITERKNKAEAVLRSILEENGITLNDESADDLYEFLLQYFEEYVSWSEQDDDMKSMELSLKDSSFFSEKEAEISALKNKRDSFQKELILAEKRLLERGDTITADTAEAAAERLSNELKALKDESKKDEDLLLRLTEETSFVQDDEQDAALSENLSAHQERLAVLKKRIRIASYISELIDDAQLRREEKIFSALAHTAAEYFHRITANQYVTAIDEHLIRDFLSGSSSVSPNPQISHLIVLSISLALTGVLTEEGIDIPLFIDEPGVYMDSQRRKNFIEIAQECSKKRQIIILTHDRSLCEGVSSVVEL